MDKTGPTGAALLVDFVYQTKTSTRPPECYGVIYGHNQGKLPKPLTSMTLDEVIKAQPSWTKRFGSSAAGAPQFMRDTLDKPGTLEDLRGELRLSGRELFLPTCRTGWLSSALSRTAFGRALAQEWASFPVLAPTKGAKRKLKRGQCFYAGDGLNEALVAPEKDEAMLDRVLAAGNRLDPVVVEKPVVADPGELETPTTKSKTFWTRLLTAIGRRWRPSAILAGAPSSQLSPSWSPSPSTASSAGMICSRRKQVGQRWVIDRNELVRFFRVSA